MAVWLFFRADTGQELVWVEERGEWTKIRRGGFAVDVANAWLAQEHQKLREMCNKGEEAVDGVAELVVSLALWLAYGAKRKHLEKFLDEYEGLPEHLQRAAAEVMDVIGLFTDRAAWRLWGMGVFPFAVEGKLGWACRVETPLEAAVKEVVLNTMHGWPRPFRFCRGCLRFFHGKACPLCRAGKNCKQGFLNVLRVHASREIKKLPPEDRAGAVRELNRIREEVKKRGVSDKLVEDYRSVCEGYGLPLNWYGRYKRR